MNEVVQQGGKEEGLSIRRLCGRVGMSRQNYYVARRYRQRRQIDEELVVKLVQTERQVQPRLGTRKLLYLLRPEWEKAGVSLGRDRFFNLLNDRKLLVDRKRAGPKTTNSRHSLPVFHNLIRDKEVTAPHQVWVSDLTYVRTEEGFLFASLITDMYSRKIVGGYIGDSLESIGCQKALEAALEQLPTGRFPIHHSDRGCQYCCHEYVERLQKRGLSISMTEEAHCYENAVAERVNGILKQEYELDATFRTQEQAREAFEQALRLYNERRPHLKLNYKTPSEAHRQAA